MTHHLSTVKPNRIFLAAAGLLLALLLGLVLNSPAEALNWATQTVENTADVGQHSSLALDPVKQYPRISYFDATSEVLKYAAWNGTTWDIEIVDDGPYVGDWTSLALDPTTGYPRISYRDRGNTALKYAAWNGTSWDIQFVDSRNDVGAYNSLALDPATGHPRISYFDSTTLSLRYAAWNGVGWQVETVDNSGHTGSYTSLALDPATGQPRISYYDTAKNMLNYAAWNGSTWDIEAVAPGGEHTSLALDPTSGFPRISYFNPNDKDLMLAFWDGRQWVTQRVDDGTDVGRFSSLALDPATGYPRISYQDTLNSVLKYAAFDGIAWTTESADFNGDVGRFSSLALDSQCGVPRISYYDSTNSALKYAAGGECATLTILKAGGPGQPGGSPFVVDPGPYVLEAQWPGNPGHNSDGENPDSYDVAIDKDGYVYTVNGWKPHIQKFDSTGTLTAQWGAQGRLGGEFVTGIRGIAIDAAGSVFVADSGNDRIQKFDSNGNFLLAFGWDVVAGNNEIGFEKCYQAGACQQASEGNGPGQFNFPRGLDVDSAGNLYVADDENGRIQKFDNNGNYIAEWNMGQNSDPKDLAVDAVGNVYVLTSGITGGLRKYDSNGTRVDEWVSPGNGLKNGLAIDEAGYLYVSEQTQPTGGYPRSRLYKLDTVGAFVALDRLQGHSKFGGLDVGPDGRVYAATVKPYWVQVFAPSRNALLPNGQSATFSLPPDTYSVTELVPPGWNLINIICTGNTYGGYTPGDVTADVTLTDGAIVTCTFVNRDVQICPAGAPGVGTELTSIVGAGMGSPDKSWAMRKVDVPDVGNLTGLYGQMAASNLGPIDAAHFLYGGRSFERVDAPTSEAGAGAVSWWGAALDPNEPGRQGRITGRWYIDGRSRSLNMPRAIVLYPTHDTGGAQYANAFQTYGWPGNYVSATPGSASVITGTLPIPETQATAALQVAVALTDIQTGDKTVLLSVTAGSVSESRVIAGPPDGRDNLLLNIEEFELLNVQAGVDEVIIKLESPPDDGDSAALLGATANYACAQP